MAKKTYTNAELTALVEEFSAEFDALVKAEVQNNEQLRKSEKNTGPNPIVKDEDGGSDKEKDSPPSDKGSDDKGSDSGGSDGPPPSGDSASASPPPGGDSAGAPPPGDPASAPPSDPASPATGGDPKQALVAAYGQLPPEELQLHFEALKEVLMAGQGMGGAGAPPPGAGAPPPAAPGGPGADPMASAASASAAPPPPAGGPGAVAPLAGEGSKPLDPASTMALKSAQEELNLAKKERDEAKTKIDGLEKSVAELTEAMTKAFSAPIRKSVTAKDVLAKSETSTVVDIESLTKAEITKRLLAKANDPKLEKKDRDTINNYYKGVVKVDALAHLLA